MFTSDEFHFWVDSREFVLLLTTFPKTGLAFHFDEYNENMDCQRSVDVVLDAEQARKLARALLEGAAALESGGE